MQKTEIKVRFSIEHGETLLGVVSIIPLCFETLYLCISSSVSNAADRIVAALWQYLAFNSTLEIPLDIHIDITLFCKHSTSTFGKTVTCGVSQAKFKDEVLTIRNEIVSELRKSVAEDVLFEVAFPESLL
ncbi:MAG: hypothetical protein RR415_12570 [Ruthenibacterium sp.]